MELHPVSIKQFKIYCDNKSAIKLTTTSNDHINIKMSFIRDNIKVRLEYIKMTNV